MYIHIYYRCQIDDLCINFAIHVFDMHKISTVNPTLPHSPYQTPHNHQTSNLPNATLGLYHDDKTHLQWYLKDTNLLYPEILPSSISGPELLQDDCALKESTQSKIQWLKLHLIQSIPCRVLASTGQCS